MDVGKVEDELLDDIWRHMTRQGLTQKELADRIGTTPASLNHYLKGRRGLLNGMAESMLEALNLRVELVPIEAPQRLVLGPEAGPGEE